MTKKYVVDLKRGEQEMLTGLIASGTQRVRKINHAHIILKADDGWTDQKISEALNVSVPTIERVGQHFVEEGIQPALSPHRTRRKYQSRKCYCTPLGNKVNNGVLLILPGA